MSQVYQQESELSAQDLEKIFPDHKWIQDWCLEYINDLELGKKKRQSNFESGKIL